MTEDSLLRELRTFVGAPIASFHRVVVWVGEQRFELEGSLLITLSDGTALQLSSDAQAQQLLRLNSLSEYTIAGEWSDRTREELVQVHGELTPIPVDSVYAVHESQTDSGAEFLIGVLLYSEGGAACAINAHLDDVRVTEPSTFWRYVETVLPSARELKLRRVT